MVQFDFIYQPPAESLEEFWIRLTFNATEWRLMGRAVQVYWGALVNLPPDNTELNNLLEPIDDIETPLALVDAPRVIKDLESAIRNSELIAFFSALAKGTPATITPEELDTEGGREPVAVGVFIIQTVPERGPQLLNGMIDYGSLDAMIAASSVMRNILRVRGTLDQLRPFISTHQPQLDLSGDVEQYAEDYARFTRTLIEAEDISAYKLVNGEFVLHQ